MYAPSTWYTVAARSSLKPAPSSVLISSSIQRRPLGVRTTAVEMSGSARGCASVSACRPMNS